jgi:hypothetical protein
MRAIADDLRAAILRERREYSSAGGLDNFDQLVDAAALAAGEGDELFRLLDDGASFGCSGDGDATRAPELEQAFVAK